MALVAVLFNVISDGRKNCVDRVTTGRRDDTLAKNLVRRVEGYGEIDLAFVPQYVVKCGTVGQSGPRRLVLAKKVSTALTPEGIHRRVGAYSWSRQLLTLSHALQLQFPRAMYY